MTQRFVLVFLIGLIASILSSGAQAHGNTATVSRVDDAAAVLRDATRQDPAYWLTRLQVPDRLILDAQAIAEQNKRLFESGSHVYRLDTLANELTRDQVVSWIAALSMLPTRPLFDEKGDAIPATTLTTWRDALALESIPDQQSTRFGLIVRRADLRMFPTAQRVFTNAGDTDIDRFQESAFFPGTPVAVVHASRDGQWLFVIGKLYAAWVATDAIALADRTTVFDYDQRQPRLIVTGANVRTVYTPQAPALSELPLDMGTSLPWLRDWPIEKPVNGQGALSSYVIELPMRDDQGQLQLMPTLIPRSADMQTAPLALTAANVIRQAFKFLGERYGWGHAYGTRDCSGFVAEVYRAFDVTLPRNTGAQSSSPAYEHIAFAKTMSHDERVVALRHLQTGDLVFIPGHVMMIIGQDNDGPWVIHDAHGLSLRQRDGSRQKLPMNGVAATPLLSLAFDDSKDFSDVVTDVAIFRTHKQL